MMNQLVRCVNCDEIFLKTPFDQMPEYESFVERSPESFRSIEKDDLQDFLRSHRGHRLEDLQIIEDSFVCEKAYSEPVKTSYFEATNGKERFVIKKFREKIDQPLKYQLVAGDYSLRCIGIEIQHREIKKQLEAEFKTSPLSQGKIAEFLALCRRVVEIIDINNLERIPEESSIPLVVYYRLDDVGLAYLLRNCRNIFKGQEYLDIEKFVQRHKDDGVLLLKATYKIHVSEKPKLERKDIRTDIPLEKKRIVEKK
jgi:hypothetical protein